MRSRPSPFRWLFVVVAGLGCSSAGGRGAATEIFRADERLFYSSDYISFIGEDDTGRVAFALDANRGRDGDRWKAEHFVVMHAEGRGWLDVRGGGDYAYAGIESVAIPDSEHFRFSGRPESGLTVTSEVNDLSLEIAPLSRTLERSHHDARFWLGSAAAVLRWDGRELPGRVIYEFLSIPGFNRLTRKYPGMWKQFHGVYARAGDDGDLYWHTQQSPLLEPLVGGAVGFLALDDRVTVFDDLQVEVLEREQAGGFYRWPVHWSGGWGSGEGAFRIELSERRRIANWIVGGFSMGIVRGTVRHDGEEVLLYGLGELLI